MPRYYLSWLAVKNDPWPHWDKDEGDRFPDDDPNWPGVPRIKRDGNDLADLGPTLSALLHPKSPCRLDKIDHAALFWDNEEKNGKHTNCFKAALERLAKVHWPKEHKKLVNKITYVCLEAVKDPTDHAQVTEALIQWAGREGIARESNKLNAEIIVNLSPGTATQHACWLMVYWRGKLGRSEAVKFVQGDGGAFVQKSLESDDDRKPLRDVRVDGFLYVGEPGVPADEAGGPLLEKFQSRRYQEIRETLNRAAALGLKVVLHGDRGTGKTFLARYYHDRRNKSLEVADEAGKKSKFTDQATAKSFVPITLSEYADVESLRQELFGWARGAFTGADEAYTGAILQAHRGTLFLDEIHHLPPPLQAALLAPLNDGSVQVKGSRDPKKSQFNLITATNDPNWRSKLADDFLDRIEEVAIELPTFNELRQSDEGLEDLLVCFRVALLDRFQRSGIVLVEPRDEQREWFLDLFRKRKLGGNWRLFHKLAANLLLASVQPLDAGLSPFRWDREFWDEAVERTFP